MPPATWAIARVRGGRELAFRHWAVERSVAIYLPVARRLVIQRRRPVKVLVERPVLPGYVFIEPQASGTVLRETSMFVSLLRNRDGVRLRVNGSTISELRQRVQSGEFDDALPSRSPRFAIGMSATIAAGPLSGFAGLVLGTFRHELLLDICGRLVRLRAHEVELRI
jgi:transcription antitermination factor NusG